MSTTTSTVNRCDQMVTYSCFRWHTLKLSNLNSYILYKERTRSPILQRVFRRNLWKALVFLLPSLQEAVQGGQHKDWPFYKLESISHGKFRALGRRAKLLNNVLFVFLPKKDFSKNRRKKEGSPASSAMSAKLPFAFKIDFSSTILFRTMLLPIFEDTMQIIIIIINILNYNY